MTWLGLALMVVLAFALLKVRRRRKARQANGLAARLRQDHGKAAAA